MELTTKVTNIGEMVPEFKEAGLLILFGPEATNELKPICVMHEFETEPSLEVLKENTRIEMGNKTYRIKKVGDAANQNFHELGHISIYFNEGSEDLLPGAVLAEPNVFPGIRKGDQIRFSN